MKEILKRATTRRRALVLAAVPALTAAGIYTTTVSAQASSPAVRAPGTMTQADSPASDCGVAGDLCFWINKDYTGDKGKVAGSNGNFGQLSGGQNCAGGNWNNCASSFYNDNTSDAFRLWQYTGDTGGAYCLDPGTAIENAANDTFSNGDSLNDAVSADYLEAKASC